MAWPARHIFKNRYRIHILLMLYTNITSKMVYDGFYQSVSPSKFWVTPHLELVREVATGRIHRILWTKRRVFGLQPRYTQQKAVENEKNRYDHEK